MKEAGSSGGDVDGISDGVSLSIVLYRGGGGVGGDCTGSRGDGWVKEAVAAAASTRSAAYRSSKSTRCSIRVSARSRSRERARLRDLEGHLPQVLHDEGYCRCNRTGKHLQIHHTASNVVPRVGAEPRKIGCDFDPPREDACEGRWAGGHAQEHFRSDLERQGAVCLDRGIEECELDTQQRIWARQRCGPAQTYPVPRWHPGGAPLWPGRAHLGALWGQRPVERA